MGLEINKNDHDEFQLISTISGECYHPNKEWISKDEAKKILINEAFNDFIEKTIEIDMSFSTHFNGKHNQNKSEYLKWIIDASHEDINQKFDEIYNRLKLEIKI